MSGGGGPRHRRWEAGAEVVSGRGASWRVYSSGGAGQGPRSEGWGGWLGPRRAQAGVGDVVQCAGRSHSDSCRDEAVTCDPRLSPPPDFPSVLQCILPCPTRSPASSAQIPGIPPLWLLLPNPGPSAAVSGTNVYCMAVRVRATHKIAGPQVPETSPQVGGGLFWGLGVSCCPL